MAKPKLTRSNIAYDLTVSPHQLDVHYDSGKKITFVFSSALYKNNFEKKHEEFRKEIACSLKKRFSIEIKCDILADLKLYSTIEKRGFLLKYNKKEIQWLDSIILDGNNLIMKN